MKMNLKDIMGTLNRDEMKKIMAGSGGGSSSSSVHCTVTCNFQGGATASYSGTCGAGSISACLSTTPGGTGITGNCIHSSCWNA